MTAFCYMCVHVTPACCIAQSCIGLYVGKVTHLRFKVVHITVNTSEIYCWWITKVKFWLVVLSYLEWILSAIITEFEVYVGDFLASPCIRAGTVRMLGCLLSRPCMCTTVELKGDRPLSDISYLCFNVVYMIMIILKTYWCWIIYSEFSLIKS